MRKQKQLLLFNKPSLEFGGSLLMNKRKDQRILATKSPIHLVLRGDTAQSGSLLKYRKTIDAAINKFSKKFGIIVENFALCFNHMHFNLFISSRENYIKFIKALTGRIAQLTRFKFLLRPYTKILSWGREFKNFIKYTIQNHKEATGQIQYKPRKKRPDKQNPNSS